MNVHMKMYAGLTCLWTKQKAWLTNCMTRPQPAFTKGCSNNPPAVQNGSCTGRQFGSYVTASCRLIRRWDDNHGRSPPAPTKRGHTHRSRLPHPCRPLALLLLLHSL